MKNVHSMRPACSAWRIGSIDEGPLSDCANDTLNEVRAAVSYYWHNVIGVTVSPFSITGSSNQFIYADNRTFRPNSSGVLFQVDGTPFGNGKGPLGPHSTCVSELSTRSTASSTARIRTSTTRGGMQPITTRCASLPGSHSELTRCVTGPLPRRIKKWVERGLQL